MVSTTKTNAFNDGMPMTDATSIDIKPRWLRQLTKNYKRELHKLEEFIATAKKNVEEEAGITLPEAQISLHGVTTLPPDILSQGQQRDAYNRYQYKLYTASKKLVGMYEDVIERANVGLQKEKDAQAMAETVNSEQTESGILRLDVGGTPMTILKKNLPKNEDGSPDVLSTMASGDFVQEEEDDFRLFLDRDPTHWNSVLRDVEDPGLPEGPWDQEDTDPKRERRKAVNRERQYLSLDQRPVHPSVPSVLAVVKAIQEALNGLRPTPSAPALSYFANLAFRYPRGKPGTFLRIYFTNTEISKCDYFNPTREKAEYQHFTNWYAVPDYKLVITCSGRQACWQAELMQAATQMFRAGVRVDDRYTLFLRRTLNHVTIEITATQN